MSNTIGGSEIAVYKYVDPALKFDDRPVYVIQTGSIDLTYRAVPTAQYNNSQITFQYFPSSEKVAVSRAMKAQVPVRFEFAGPDQGCPLLNVGSTDAPRCFSFGIDTTKLQIDTGSADWQESDVFYAIQRYISENAMTSELEYALITPDSMTSYDDWTKYGSGGNVLSQQFEQGLGKVLPGRGGYPEITIVTNTNTSAIVDVLYTVPIWLSPMDFRCNSHSKDLIGVSTLTYIITFNNNLQVLWSHAPQNGTTFTAGYPKVSICPQVVSPAPPFSYAIQPSLLVSEYTLQPTDYIPEKVFYNYNQVKTDISQIPGGIASGSNGLARSGAITLSQTPECIYIYVRRIKQDWSYSTTNTAAVIENISIGLDTRNSLLAQATPLQLYQICKKNGYNGSYGDFRKYSGSFIKLNFGEDIPLGPLDSVGRQNKHQLNIQVSFKNQSDESINYELVVLTVYQGIMIKEYAMAQFQTGIVSANDVLNSNDLPEISRDIILMNQAYRGGDLVGSLKNFYTNKLKPLAKKGVNLAKKYGPTAIHLAKKYGPEIMEALAPLLAAGYSEEDALEELKRMQGGKLMAKGKLAKRLRNY